MTTLKEDGLYGPRDVAELVLGHPVRWFRRHRKRLEAEEGFPAPVSRIGRPRWSGRALIAWRDRGPSAGNQGEPARPAEPQDKPKREPDYLAIIRARIAKKREERDRRHARILDA